MTTVANAMSEHDEFTPRSRYHLLLFEAVSRWSCFITKPFPLCFIAASRGQMCQDCQRALNKSSMSSISHQSERLPRQILTRSFVKPRITIAAKDHALSPRSDGPGERMHQLTNKQNSRVRAVQDFHVCSRPRSRSRSWQRPRGKGMKRKAIILGHVTLSGGLVSRDGFGLWGACALDLYL